MANPKSQRQIWRPFITFHFGLSTSLKFNADKVLPEELASYDQMETSPKLVDRCLKYFFSFIVAGSVRTPRTEAS